MTTLKSKGFTLIEILIALMIFAFVAVMTSIGLRNITNSRNVLNARSKQIATLQLAMTIMQQDISQMVNRSAFVEGTQQAALVAAANSIKFTTANNPNIGGLLPHSDLFRVEYSVASSGLTRKINLFVDSDSKAKPITETILPDVNSIKFKFVNSSGQMLTYWYSQLTNTIIGVAPNSLPQAIIVDIDIKGLGQIERIFQRGENYIAAQ